MPRDNSYAECPLCGHVPPEPPGNSYVESFKLAGLYRGARGPGQHLGECPSCGGEAVIPPEEGAPQCQDGCSQNTLLEALAKASPSRWELQTDPQGEAVDAVRALRGQRV